jgi:hypothetical protein
MAYTNYPWREPFLAALREVPVLRHACDVTGVERSTVQKARKADAAFDQAIEDAMETGVDRAEQEAFRRAVVGFEEPVLHQGQLTPRFTVLRDDEGDPVLDELTGEPKLVAQRDEHGNLVPLTVRKHSDALLALVLKGRRKKVYADRTELTGADGEPLAIDETARAARMASLLKAAAERKELDDLV